MGAENPSESFKILHFPSRRSGGWGVFMQNEAKTAILSVVLSVLKVKC